MTHDRRRRDRGRVVGRLVAMAALTLVAAACGSTSPSATTVSSTIAPASTASAAPSAPPTSVAKTTAPPSAGPVASQPSSATDRNPTRLEPGTAYHPSIDPADYVQDIDNPFWPLKPGTHWTFKSAD